MFGAPPPPQQWWYSAQELPRRQPVPSTERWAVGTSPAAVVAPSAQTTRASRSSTPRGGPISAAGTPSVPCPAMGLTLGASRGFAAGAAPPQRVVVPCVVSAASSSSQPLFSPLLGSSSARPQPSPFVRGNARTPTESPAPPLRRVVSEKIERIELASPQLGCAMSVGSCPMPHEHATFRWNGAKAAPLASSTQQLPTAQVQSSPRLFNNLQQCVRPQQQVAPLVSRMTADYPGVDYFGAQEAEEPQSCAKPQQATASSSSTKDPPLQVRRSEDSLYKSARACKGLGEAQQKARTRAMDAEREVEAAKQLWKSLDQQEQTLLAQTSGSNGRNKEHLKKRLLKVELGKEEAANAYRIACERAASEQRNIKEYSKMLHTERKASSSARLQLRSQRGTKSEKDVGAPSDKNEQKRGAAPSKRSSSSQRQRRDSREPSPCASSTTSCDMDADNTKHGGDLDLKDTASSLPLPARSFAFAAPPPSISRITRTRNSLPARLPVASETESPLLSSSFRLAPSVPESWAACTSQSAAGSTVVPSPKPHTLRAPCSTTSNSDGVAGSARPSPRPLIWGPIGPAASSSDAVAGSPLHSSRSQTLRPSGSSPALQRALASTGLAATNSGTFVSEDLPPRVSENSGLDVTDVPQSASGGQPSPWRTEFRSLARSSRTLPPSQCAADWLQQRRSPSASKQQVRSRESRQQPPREIDSVGNSLAQSPDFINLTRAIKLPRSLSQLISSPRHSTPRACVRIARSENSSTQQSRSGSPRRSARQTVAEVQQLMSKVIDCSLETSYATGVCAMPAARVDCSRFQALKEQVVGQSNPGSSGSSEAAALSSTCAGTSTDWDSPHGTSSASTVVGPWASGASCLTTPTAGTVGTSGDGILPLSSCADDEHEEGASCNVAAAGPSRRCSASGGYSEAGAPHGVDFQAGDSAALQRENSNDLDTCGQEEEDAESCRLFLDAMNIAQSLPTRWNELSAEERGRLTSHFTRLRGLLHLPHGQHEAPAACSGS